MSSKKAKYRLKAPKKNFGWLPEVSPILHLLNFFFVCFLGFFLSLTMTELDGTWTPGGAFLAGCQLMGICMYAMRTVKFKRSFSDGYLHSKKLRYIRKQLIPFLSKKYKIDLNLRFEEDILDFISGEKFVSGLVGKKEVFLIGWESIEYAAAGYHNSPLEDSVHLVRITKDKKLEEIPWEGEAEERLAFSRFRKIGYPKKQAELYEELIGFLHASSVGTTIFYGKDMNNLSSSAIPKPQFTVKKTEDGELTYSLDEYNDFVADVALMDETLIYTYVQHRDGKVYVYANIFEDGYSMEVDDEELQEILGEDYVEGAILLYSIEDVPA